MGPRGLGPSGPCGYTPVSVKKWFEALTGKFLSFVVSYISHFICSYNLNYNFGPLRGPSVILIIHDRQLRNCVTTALALVAVGFSTRL